MTRSFWPNPAPARAWECVFLSPFEDSRCLSLSLSLSSMLHFDSSILFDKPFDPFKRSLYPIRGLLGPASAFQAPILGCVGRGCPPRGRSLLENSGLCRGPPRFPCWPKSTPRSLLFHSLHFPPPGQSIACVQAYFPPPLLALED